ncbi:MAG: F0F1 ATP synthase subunit B family protein [Alphaproteobacteria bacterium]
MNKIQQHILKAGVGAFAMVMAVPAIAQEKSAGLPQLDFTTFAPQLIWLAITFVVLYLLMARVAMPRIGQVIEERAHRIEDNLKKAETLRGEAAAASEAYEAALADARAEAHSVMVKVRDQIAEETASKLAGLSDKLEAKMKKAEDHIAEEKDKALATLADISTEVASAMAEKLTGGSISDKDVAAAVAGAMEARR